jgi:hypothetical protein
MVHPGILLLVAMGVLFLVSVAVTYRNAGELGALVPGLRTDRGGAEGRADEQQ